ncbi:MAG: ATP-dependent helicase HrpB [Granulosicoccaceae bacterium]
MSPSSVQSSNHPAVYFGTSHIHTLPDTVLALPVMALANDIAQALSERNVILRAEPGAGKSTGLPLALLLSLDLHGKIILLEPRRLAARSIAQRLASHLGEKVGQRIGLRMRSDTRVSAETQLTVVTEGVLTRLLQKDPSLNGIGLVVFDEFHERSLHADLGLALSLEVQQALRPDLRLLLMSATLDADSIHSQLSKFQSFHCSVRQHPVETVWMGEHSDPLAQGIAHAALTAIDNHEGDVLVFLPGVAEINRAAKILQPRLQNTAELHQLHSGVGLDAQLKATAPACVGNRRVILATSLAETSITIDGVRVVIDSGLERRGRVDTATGAQRLETVMASQASATQRSGRAGRTSAGVCYRLWSEAGHTRRSAHWQPEIFRADLAPLLLELGLWGVTGYDELPWLDVPPSASIARADALLTRLGLWKDRRLTTHGRAVAALPVHPRLGNMLCWAAKVGGIQVAAQLAVLLEDNIRGANLVDIEPSLTSVMPSSLQRRAAQIARSIKVDATQHSSPAAAALLAQAYPDWIAQRRPGDAGKFHLACGAGVIIDGEDALAQSQFLSVAQLGGAGSQLRIFKALALDIEELQCVSPELFNTVNYLDWDDKQQRVLAEQRLMIGNLVISTKPMQHINNGDKATALVAGIRQLGITCLPWNDDCREWQARVIRMRKLSPVQGNSMQDNDWPEVDDEALLNHLDEWLAPWLGGIGSIKALKQLNLYKSLNAMLDYRQQSLMDEWLPLRYTVPSGSKIRLRYTQAGEPVLSVKLQELLGCSHNPSIANGQIVLKIEFLSPARRPIQVTSDLASFWSNGYAAVKKDMKGRYPKHDWPEDPLAAAPTAYAKRRKK